MARDGTGRDYWDRHAKNYDRSMAILGGPIPRMVALAADAVRGSARVLEVAAGTGLVTTSLARAADEVVATDYAAAMVAALEARVKRDGLTNVRCEQADVYALRFEPGSFDAVVAANVLHLVPDLEGAIAALVRVLRPGGRLVVPTYCHAQTTASRVLSRLLAVTGFPGRRRFTLERLRDAVETAGIEISRVELLPGLIPIGYVEGTAPARR
jgi:ubiquinone/menaquinone biosynthesis C-methylase UbiE